MQTHFVDGAPRAIGPYCHALEAGPFVFCSGQTPLDPDSMTLVGGDIAAQTRRVFDNLRIVLNGLGLDLSHIVKTTVFLKDMDDFAAMNAMYTEMMGDHRPARTTIAVRQNPLDALVEIECIAYRG